MPLKRAFQVCCCSGVVVVKRIFDEFQNTFILLKNDFLKQKLKACV